MTTIDSSLSELLASINRLFDSWEQVELARAQKRIAKLVEMRAKITNRVVQQVNSYQQRLVSMRPEETLRENGNRGREVR